MSLEPEQPGAALDLRMALERALFVLPHPGRQVGGHADIERAVAPVGNDIGRDKGAMRAHWHNLYALSTFVIPGEDERWEPSKAVRV